MSRNFELLQRAHSLIERTALFTAANAAEPALAAAAPVADYGREAGARLPSSLLDAAERRELLKLVCGVFRPGNAGAPRVVVISAVDELAPSAWITGCAGELLAQQVREPVCIVDANFGRHGLHSFFGAENGRGLSDAAAGIGSIRDYCVRVAGGLFLLSAGSHTSEDDGPLPRESICARLAQLRREFGHTLIAAPPVATSGDVLALGQVSDGVLLVLEANGTRRDAALAAKELLSNAKIPVLGAVLNNRTFPIPETLYARL